jgi:hypothetical protein
MIISFEHGEPCRLRKGDIGEARAATGVDRLFF